MQIISTPLSQSVFGFDNAYHAYVDMYRWESIRESMLALTHLGDPISLLFISIAVLLVLWLLKKPVQVIQFAITMVFASGLVFVLKHLINRDRPIGIIPEDGYSFPSGHALVAAVFFPLIIYCFRRYIKPLWLERVFILIMIFLMLAVAWSRLYLGVHYASDVIGGLLIGVLVSSFSILFTESYLRKHGE